MEGVERPGPNGRQTDSKTVVAEDGEGTPRRESFRRCDGWQMGTSVEASKRIVERLIPMECEAIGRDGAIFATSEILLGGDSRNFHSRAFPGTRIVVVPQRISTRSVSCLEGQGRCVRPKGGLGGFEESGTPRTSPGSPALQPAPSCVDRNTTARASNPAATWTVKTCITSHDRPNPRKEAFVHPPSKPRLPFHTRQVTSTPPRPRKHPVRVATALRELCGGERPRRMAVVHPSEKTSKMGRPSKVAMDEWKAEDRRFTWTRIANNRHANALQALGRRRLVLMVLHACGRWMDLRLRRGFRRDPSMHTR